MARSVIFIGKLFRFYSIEKWLMLIVPIYLLDSIYFQEWFPSYSSWRHGTSLKWMKSDSKIKRLASIISKFLSRLHSQKFKFRDNEIFSLTLISTVFCKTVVTNYVCIQICLSCLEKCHWLTFNLLECTWHLLWIHWKY